MSVYDRHGLHRQADRLEAPAAAARELAEKLGLAPVPVTYWLVDYDEMNQLVAYDGFPTRYPHWRWGMKYERQRRLDSVGQRRAFELVIHDDPAHAFLQESNEPVDQKAVITHVEAHADFFANNRWFGLFGDEPDAAARMEAHGRRIAEYMADPEIGREAVERWIDSVLPLTETIDQYRPYDPDPADPAAPAADESSPIADLDLSADVEGAIFDDEWLEDRADEDPDEGPGRDLLAFLRRHGRQYDEDERKAVEMADWQKDVLDILRAEAHYFAAQRMTKVMNEGWASHWMTIMMGAEAFADDAEFIDYAEHMTMILGSPGLNPYALGKQLWEHIENRANRREVLERLLRVEGVTPETFFDRVDIERVLALLDPEPPLDSITEATLPDLAALDPAKVDEVALDRALSGDLDIDGQSWRVLSYEGLAERHFSLTKPQHRGVLRRVDRSQLAEIDRYLFEADRYPDVEAAIDAVEYTAGWDKLFAVRESHNDVTFIDEFLTPAFIRENDYFTYEYSHATGDNRVASREPEDVKRKLLLQFTNFGKPTITVADGNYNNRNELLLAHEYNGIQLDLDEAADTLERVFDLWGRPVNLKTIVKVVDDRDREVARRRGREPEPEEEGRLLRYDGEEFTMEELDWGAVEDIAATDVDYGTKPDDWLS